ncbi:Las1-domain-containing protein [Byssothecium circinans]|uniref:Las1-domain-containing protein n=1 Tax=Byssothecium circinans TaxID=147558 RepID=A0A6A5U1H6_9PLEO|nr:Las1-domain-containing protein [Byssothecium circinans]
MDVQTRFVVTAWRDREELLRVRREIFGEDLAARERAVNKIFAWRVRKHELPLLLESTADIVDAVIQDELGLLPHHALRLVYATTISRFITGLADTQTDLSRLRPSFFPPQTTLQFPLALRETRHCIVHRHLPSLAELKRAAKESLDWLWEWYWSHLDAAFANAGEDGGLGKERLSEREVKERLQGALKAYVRARKNEVKSKAKESKAAGSAMASYDMLDVQVRMKHKILLELLVDEQAILPADKRFGTSMSGAFLIWTPFLTSLCKGVSGLLQLLLERMVYNMSVPTMKGMVDVEQDPARQGMHDWVVHMLSSPEWEEARGQRIVGSMRRGQEWLVEYTLSQAFLTPMFWTLKLAESLLKDEKLTGRESWIKILEAAKSEGAIDIDEEEQNVADLEPPEEMGIELTQAALPITSSKMEVTTVKLRGPQKKVGLWKPQPIGMVPVGWDDDKK